MLFGIPGHSGCHMQAGRNNWANGAFVLPFLTYMSTGCVGSRSSICIAVVMHSICKHILAGWHKGARRAVLLAGLKHPDYIHSGITQYPDVGVVSDEDEQKFGISHRMPMTKQIRQFKYVINVDGWCGSKRMKTLLGSDSAILNLVSMEEEWYSPLLVPGKHYIPVRFEHDDKLEDETDLVDQIKWAQEHPDNVAKIVQHAKHFHAFYMSQRGEQCFAVQLLEEYHKLLLDPEQLQMVAAGTLLSV